MQQQQELHVNIHQNEERDDHNQIRTTTKRAEEIQIVYDIDDDDKEEEDDPEEDQPNADEEIRSISTTHNINSTPHNDDAKAEPAQHKVFIYNSYNYALFTKVNTIKREVEVLHLMMKIMTI